MDDRAKRYSGPGHLPNTPTGQKDHPAQDWMPPALKDVFLRWHGELILNAEVPDEVGGGSLSATDIRVLAELHRTSLSFGRCEGTQTLAQLREALGVGGNHIKHSIRRLAAVGVIEHFLPSTAGRPKKVFPFPVTSRCLPPPVMGAIPPSEWATWFDKPEKEWVVESTSSGKRTPAGLRQLVEGRPHSEDEWKAITGERSLTKAKQRSKRPRRARRNPWVVFGDFNLSIRPTVEIPLGCDEGWIRELESAVRDLPSRLVVDGARAFWGELRRAGVVAEVLSEAQDQWERACSTPTPDPEDPDWLGRAERRLGFASAYRAEMLDEVDIEAALRSFMYWCEFVGSGAEVLEEVWSDEGLPTSGAMRIESARGFLALAAESAMEFRTAVDRLIERRSHPVSDFEHEFVAVIEKCAGRVAWCRRKAA